MHVAMPWRYYNYYGSVYLYSVIVIHLRHIISKSLIVTTTILRIYNIMWIVQVYPLCMFIILCFCSCMKYTLSYTENLYAGINAYFIYPIYRHY